MADFAVTHTFSNTPPNTNTIDADQVNTNFDDVENELDRLVSAYRTLLGVGGPTDPDLAAGTYGIGVNTLFATGANATPVAVYLAAADFSLTNRTTKLRLRAQVSTNATAPAITFTFGLYPVTFAGGTDLLTATLGTVVTGSTVAIASPAASSTTQGNSGDFAFPSDGQYCV